jgi:hypothetical protein
MLGNTDTRIIGGQIYIGYGSQKGEAAVGNPQVDEPTKYTKKYLERVIEKVEKVGYLEIPTDLITWPGVTEIFADTIVRAGYPFRLEVDLDKYLDEEKYVDPSSDEEFRDEKLALEISEEDIDD